MYVDFLEADGERVFEQACRMGLEGIVAKRVDTPYRSGRQDSWIKLKCVKSDTFPIIAFVEKLGARPRKIASLYVGRWEGDRLIYAGKARSGYTEAVARELRERLDPLIRKTSPLSVPVKKPKATWVEPKVDAEIEYSAITDDGLLRAAVFKGLRDDLAAPPVKAPSIIPAGGRRKPHIGVPTREHSAAAAGCRRTHKGGTRRLLGEGAQARAGASRPSTAQTRAACPRNDLLSQGTAAEGHPEFGAPTAHAENARAAKAPACGWIALMGCLVLLRSAPSNCIPGMRLWRISNEPIGS